MHHCLLKGPRRLPFAVRDFLLKDEAAGNVGLLLYLEDDLVIQSCLYLENYCSFSEN